MRGARNVVAAEHGEGGDDRACAICFFFFFCVAQYDCTQTTLTTTKPHLNGFTHEVTINGSLACLGLVGRKGP